MKRLNKLARMTPEEKSALKKNFGKLQMMSHFRQKWSPWFWMFQLRFCSKSEPMVVEFPIQKSVHVKFFTSSQTLLSM